MGVKNQRVLFWIIVISRGLCLLAGAGSVVLAFLSGGDSQIWPLPLFFASVGFLCLWFAFRGHIARERILILIGVASGCVVGLFSFVGGLYWASLQCPESNLSGLVAYLFTGPLGFSIGAVLGILVAGLKARRRAGLQI